MNKKQRYQVTTLCLAALSIIAVIYFSPMQYLVTGYAQLDSDLKHLVSIITVAGLGLTLFAIRQLNITKEQIEQIEAWDLAVMIVIPSAEIFAYIMKTPTNYSSAIFAYVMGVMIWFLLVICRHKIFKDPKEERKFNLTVWWAMSVFVIFGIFAFWEIITLLPYMNIPGHQ